MKVIAKQQAGHNEPVEIVWCPDGDDLGVMLSVTQILRHAKEDSPWSPKVLEIRIEL